MLVADLVSAAEALAPSALAEPWDNVGLLLGDPAATLRAVLVTIDLTPAVIAEARTLGADAVVAYHPPLFTPARRLGPGDLAFEALRAGLAVYSPHTALDVADGGTNDVLVDLLELGDRRPLAPRAPGGPGLGRVGALAAPTPLDALLARIKERLALSHLLVAGRCTGLVRTIAVCAGDGGAFVRAARDAGAELYLVGELRHHDALLAARLGLCAVCTLHSNNERMALPSFAARLGAALPGVPVHVSRADCDPYRLV
jgi:dinuclear metal center YbgI/SA1388 family protein